MMTRIKFNTLARLSAVATALEVAAALAPEGRHEIVEAGTTRAVTRVNPGVDMVAHPFSIRIRHAAQPWLASAEVEVECDDADADCLRARAESLMED